jgi:hypothetical protein
MNSGFTTDYETLRGQSCQSLEPTDDLPGILLAHLFIRPQQIIPPKPIDSRYGNTDTL